MQVLSPVPDKPSARQAHAGATFSLEGMTVALVNNGWPFLDVIYEHMERRLQDEHGAADVVRSSIPMSNRAPNETYDEIAKSADVAIIGCAT